MNQSEVSEFYKKWGIVTDDEGRMKSEQACWCGNPDIWVKVTIKPFRWESDVMQTTFAYTCKNYGSTWHEYDSD